MRIQPFRIDIPDEAVTDLRDRLRAARWPAGIDATGWEDGASIEFIHMLADRWANHFNWREHQERLNRLPQFTAEISDHLIHFVNQPGRGTAPIPLVLTHGWPGSFAEFERIIPMLTDPGAHGADAADAFHVVVPSLPGFAFSPAPRRSGTSSRRVADLWQSLMTGLGYPRFVAQGGDIGAGVAMWLARDHPDSVAGVHLNYVPGSFRPWLGAGAPPVTAEEQAFLNRAGAFAAEEGAYAALHATKPQSLALALTDSPVGLASWIAEKFRSWSDNDGDMLRALPMDTILTGLSLYWFSNTLDASLRIYKENRLQALAFGVGDRIGVPVGVACFPRELPMPPRSWVERAATVTRWSQMPAGGHFAALEQPELLAADIRAFCRPLRG